MAATSGITRNLTPTETHHLAVALVVGVGAAVVALLGLIALLVVLLVRRRRRRADATATKPDAAGPHADATV